MAEQQQQYTQEIKEEQKQDADVGALELEPEQFRKIFVGGLPASAPDDMVREYYSAFGAITDMIVMRDPSTGRSRGFGFITFATRPMVDAAMAARPHVIDGKTVDPKRAVPRDEKNRSETNISTARLYISGVREDHTEQILADYFSKFGKVLKSEIILDKITNKPRGFAFVTFDDYDAVDKCVLIRSHHIGEHRCDVRKGLEKNEMAKAQMLRDKYVRQDRFREMGPRRGFPGGPDRRWGSPSSRGRAGYQNAPGGGYNRGFNGGSSVYNQVYENSPVPNYGNAYPGAYGTYGDQRPANVGWQGQPLNNWNQSTPPGNWGPGVQTQWDPSVQKGVWSQSGAQQWSNAHSQSGGRY